MNQPKNIRELSELWKTEKAPFVKASTMAAYTLALRTHIVPHFGEMQTFNETDVQQFVLAKTTQGMSRKTIVDLLTIIKMLLKFGVKKKWMNYQDWDIQIPNAGAKKQIEVFTIAEQRLILHYIEHNFSFKNLGIYICLNTGMRIGEICALTWGDIDLQKGIIKVEKTIERIYNTQPLGSGRHTQLIINTPKTENSYREIPISNHLMKLIKPLSKLVHPHHYVLTNEVTPTEPRTYRNYYGKLIKKLGLKPLKFHGLRHSFATRCIESKCDYKTISVILGHSNIQTTLNLYVHPNLEQKKRCINKMTKLFK